MNETQEKSVTVGNTPSFKNATHPFWLKSIQYQNSTCYNITRPRTTTYASTGNYWHSQREGKDVMFVYSAFYDNRPPVGKLPSLRLLTVSTFPANALIYCYVWYAGVEIPYITKVSIVASGHGHTVGGVFYGQWLYSCSLPANSPIPTHVSLSANKCQNSDILVPVYNPKVLSSNSHEFGVCVEVMYGEIDFAAVSEWIELNLMFGVSELHIYNGTMSTNMNKIFNVYRERGVLNLHQIPPPVPEYSITGTYLGSPASLNDCMLRYAYRYKYIVVIDTDEIIVPRKQLNYSSMLKQIDEAMNLTKSSISYSFRNLYHFRDLEPDMKQPTYLRSMRYLKHAKPSPFLYGAKSFIDPRYCLSVFNHYCLVQFPGSPGTIDVPLDIACSHHYRKCGFSQEECTALMNESYHDDYMLNFKNKFNQKVLDTLQQIDYF